MKAKTDAGPTTKNQEKPVEIQNLFALMGSVSKKETIQYFEQAYNDCTIRYGDMKKQLFEDMNAFLTPIRERIKEFSSNESYLNEVMALGEQKARKSAEKTIKEVREIIGFRA